MIGVKKLDFELRFMDIIMYIKVNYMYIRMDI